MNSSWETSQQHRSRNIYIASAIVFVILIASLFMFNNADQLFQAKERNLGKDSINTTNHSNLEAKDGKGEKHTDSGMAISSRQSDTFGSTRQISVESSTHGKPVPVAAKEKVKDTKSSDEHGKPVDLLKTPAISNKKEEISQKNPLAKQESPKPQMVEIPAIGCVFADQATLSLKLGVRLSVDNSKAREEVLFKRDQIGILIKKAVQKKPFAELDIEKLRGEIKLSINQILQNGTILDLEFTDLKPVVSMADER